MTDNETTTEQLAEIEGQGESTPATGYTPPEGWRVVRFGELLLPGDVWVNWDGTEARPDILHGDGTTASGGRYIRRIKPQPQPQPESQPEPQPEPAVQGGLVRDVTHLLEESGVLDSAKAEQQIEELRSEVSYVQNLLGTERRRVTELEELVGSLRTINVTQEKAFTAAGKENTALRNQLAAVKAELASVAADRQQLRVELDAAQQVPADSSELRQLRENLAEVTRDRDQYLDSYQRIFGDLETIRETTKAETVEAIAEWLEPIRLVDSAYLANATMQHLPSIMRSLTGLDSPDHVD